MDLQIVQMNLYKKQINYELLKKFASNDDWKMLLPVVWNELLEGIYM